MGFRPVRDLNVRVARNPSRNSLTVEIDADEAAALRTRFGVHGKYVLETIAGAGKRFIVRPAKTGRELQARDLWEFPADWGASQVHGSWPDRWSIRPAVKGQIDANGVIRFTLPKIKDCQGKPKRVVRPVEARRRELMAEAAVPDTRPPEVIEKMIPLDDQLHRVGGLIDDGRAGGLARLPVPRPRRTFLQVLADLFRDSGS